MYTSFIFEISLRAISDDIFSSFNKIQQPTVNIEQTLKLSSTTGCLLKQFLHFKTLLSDLPLRVFVCTIFVQTRHPSNSKLDPRALKCVFLGYSSTKKGYKCYSVVTKRTYISMDITFLETKPYYPKIVLQGECLGESHILDEFQPFIFEETIFQPNVTIDPPLKTISPSSSETILPLIPTPQTPQRTQLEYDYKDCWQN
ncbi:hypothetical protein GQ457_14G016060 [Hibiscus cannabinus]